MISTWVVHQILIYFDGKREYDMKKSHQDTVQVVFNGSVEKRASIFGAVEKFLTREIVPKIPKQIETYHLTLATLPLSLCVLVFSYLSKSSMYWLIGVCACILFQYLTDLFDGSVGRQRNTGLVKWGFLMDHFLDYIFFISLVFGWSYLVKPEYFTYIFISMASWGGAMINSFLYYGAANTFKISYAQLGPTEFRVLLIIAYLIAILWGPSFFSTFVPLIAIGSVVVLIAVVYSSHRSLWALDMQRKSRQRNLQKNDMIG